MVAPRPPGPALRQRGNGARRRRAESFLRSGLTVKAPSVTNGVQGEGDFAKVGRRNGATQATIRI